MPPASGRVVSHFMRRWLCSLGRGVHWVSGRWPAEGGRSARCEGNGKRRSSCGEVCHDSAQKVHGPIGSIGSIAENSPAMTSYPRIPSPQSVSSPLTSSGRIREHCLS